MTDGTLSHFPLSGKCGSLPSPLASILRGSELCPEGGCHSGPSCSREPVVTPLSLPLATLSIFRGSPKTARAMFDELVQKGSKR